MQVDIIAIKVKNVSTVMRQNYKSFNDIKPINNQNKLQNDISHKAVLVNACTRTMFVYWFYSTEHNFKNERFFYN